jgi:hypothetical protein
MKIRVYIVTYRRDDVLNLNLRTLWSGASHPELLEVTVISNHPEVCIEESNQRPNLRVLINQTRHLNSWGYLARDWNFAIIDAFRTWENPDQVDWCVLAQNDVEWLPGWDQWIASQKNFDLVSQPVGDAVVALNIEAVRKVGLFDERFCTLHFHDIDFLNRAAVALGRRASITDTHFGARAAFNPVGNVLIKTSATGFVDDDPTLHTRKSWPEMRGALFSKWGFHSLEEAVDRESHARRFTRDSLPREPLIYPYFWSGMVGALNQHLSSYRNRGSEGGTLSGLYDRLMKQRPLWALRCWMVSRLGLEDGYERRRLLREEEQRLAPYSMS